RDFHSGLAGAPGFFGQMRRIAQGAQRPSWAWDVGIRGLPHTLGNVAPILAPGAGINDFFGWIGANFDPSVTWRDLDWVRAEWNGPLIVKGVLDADDAADAASVGVNGIVVSNHGGRQLDGVLSSARALPRIAERVGDRMSVLVDGGVRSGLDVMRMLALGAHGILIGRAWAYALGARGQAGVAHVLDIMARELRVAMALTGVTHIADISSDLLDR
ncbi:MAG TPA: alpha-hydroxy-acid oxidizing protein, partial [Verrucomicrobiae bacterium]|nr:alpha-hydroxy-acid oxidizing protein [Verrucomicrobiae bacterium]